MVYKLSTLRLWLLIPNPLWQRSATMPKVLDNTLGKFVVIGVFEDIEMYIGLAR